MIPDELETLEYGKLSNLEKQQYSIKVTTNYTRLMLQLANSGDSVLVAVMSTALNLAKFGPQHLFMLHEYGIELMNLLQQELALRTEMERQAEANKAPEATEGVSPPDNESGEAELEALPDDAPTN